MEGLHDLLILLGRIFISITFLWISLVKIRHWQGTADYMKSKNIPHVEIVHPLSVGLQLLGSLMILFGVFARLGAIFLLIYLIPATFWLHSFWKMQEPERKNEQMFFMKDVAIWGGLLLIVAMGSGPWSLVH